MDAGVNGWLDVYPARLEPQPYLGLQAVLRNVSGNADICSSLGNWTGLMNHEWCMPPGALVRKSVRFAKSSATQYAKSSATQPPVVPI